MAVLKTWLLLLSLCMFGCIIACLCSSEWVKLTTQSKNGNTIAVFHHGLWKECVEDFREETVCMDIGSGSSESRKNGLKWLIYVKGLVISASISSALVILCNIIGYCYLKSIYASTVLALLSGIKMLIALVLFQRANHWVREYNFVYGVSFHIGICGSCLCGISFFTGILISVLCKDKSFTHVKYCCHGNMEKKTEIDLLMKNKASIPENV